VAWTGETETNAAQGRDALRTHILNREPSRDAGTFGKLVLDTGETFYTGELPWRDNHPDYSCIPPAIYRCEWALSPSKGWCYHVRNVPDRQNVLIHAGNWCGDTTKVNLTTTRRYLSDVLGCILLGMSVGILKQQPAILQSRDAVQKFNDLMAGESFELVIRQDDDPVASGGGGDE